jgi:Helix-hairpin-helix motif
MASEPRRSRAWRLEHTWWLFLILLSVGFFSWASFAYIAYRTKVRRWFAWAAGYGAGIVVSFTFLTVGSEDSWQVGVGTVLLLAVWGGSFIHGLAIREEVLDRLSFDEDPRLRTARAQVFTRDAAGELAGRTPTLALEAGIGQDAGSFGGLIDINNAPASELARLPDFTEELATRVVEVREDIGGFDSVLDFATVIDLPPSVVNAIRERVVCLPR